VTKRVRANQRLDALVRARRVCMRARGRPLAGGDAARRRSERRLRRVATVRRDLQDDF
jgi:hypothetical protein